MLFLPVIVAAVVLAGAQTFPTFAWTLVGAGAVVAAFLALRHALSRKHGEGKPVLITGGAGGIGGATALKLVDHGFHVYVVDVSAASLPAEMPGKLTPIKADITKREDMLRVVERIADQHDGCLYALMNNAAVSGWREPAVVSGQNLENLRRTLDVNIVGHYITTNAAWPLLVKAARSRVYAASGGPRILTTSSMLGLTCLPFGSPYIASKHAIEGFMDAMRQEVAMAGLPIHVITINPGVVDTPITTTPDWTGLNDQEHRDFAPPFRRLAVYWSKMQGTALSPEFVGTRLRDAIEAVHPFRRYRIVPDVLPTAMLEHMPDALRDLVLIAVLRGTLDPLLRMLIRGHGNAVKHNKGKSKRS